MFCVTASAVPRYHLLSLHPLRCGQDVQIFVPLGPEEAPAALHVADQAECALYCVAIAILRMPEFSAFDRAKSMIRVLPPK